MSPEHQRVSPDHLATYRELFVHQDRRFAAQAASGSYILCERPVTDDLIRSHLDGLITAGWYAFDGNNTIKWVVADADAASGLSDLQKLWQEFRRRGLPLLIEASRRGGHAWLPAEPMPARPLRQMVIALVERAQIEPVEVFPKQDELKPGHVGSVVRGPLGIHRKDGRSYGFVDPQTLEAIGLAQIDQLDYLTSFERVTASQVADTLARLWQEKERPATNRTAERRSDDGVIAQLKETIDIAALVSQYVELDNRGRGHCPFHGPDRHPSFVVNADQGYFVDFHDGSGGDAIEFYRRMKGLAPREAIKELARQFL